MEERNWLKNQTTLRGVSHVLNVTQNLLNFNVDATEAVFMIRKSLSKKVASVAELNDTLTDGTMYLI